MKQFTFQNATLMVLKYVIKNTQLFVPLKETKYAFHSFSPFLTQGTQIKNYREQIFTEDYSINTVRTEIMTHKFGSYYVLHTYQRLLGYTCSQRFLISGSFMTSSSGITMLHLATKHYSKRILTNINWKLKCSHYHSFKFLSYFSTSSMSLN